MDIGLLLWKACSEIGALFTLPSPGSARVWLNRGTLGPMSPRSRSAGRQGGWSEHRAASLGGFRRGQRSRFWPSFLAAGTIKKHKMEMGAGQA